MRDRREKKQAPFILTVVLDIVLAGVVLVVIAYFHHVNPINRKDLVSEALPEPPAIEEPAATPEPTPIPITAEPGEQTEPAATPEPTEESRFLPAGSEPVTTEDSFTSENVSVTMSTSENGGCVFHIADIYLRDVRYLHTYLAGGEFKGAWSSRDYVPSIAGTVGAYVAINGDQFAARKEGVTVRDGVLYREVPYEDVCVLNYDGSLVTYDKGAFDIEKIKAEGAWQVWSFGPRLLDDDGQPMTEFNSTVQRENPRTAIGMYEPNHLVFVTVDGRSEASSGITLADLSAWFYELGCKSAYNLDGGATSQMSVGGEYYNNPSGDRGVTDIIYIGME